MTALFLTGYLQFPPDWTVMEKAISAGDPELYYSYICALRLDLGISPAQDRNFHQICYRGRKMNYPPILNRLAITYLCGIGCKQNVQLAKKYFTRFYIIINKINIIKIIDHNELLLFDC